MTRAPKVSVVMPSYNHARFVAGAVQSVLGQSLGDLELCIVDDASTDGTPDVVAAIRDARIRFERSPANRGAAATLNAAIRLSSGDYIAVLNSDDAFLPGKLARQVELLDTRPELAAVFAYPRFVDDDGRPLPPEQTFYGSVFFAENRSRVDWLRQFFLRGNCLCHPSAMIRRASHERVGLYDERLAQLHDLDVWLRVLLGDDIWIVPEALIDFRIRSGAGNASALRADTETRTTWEEARVLRRYADLPDDLFDRVFDDEIARLRIDRRQPRAFKLAAIALARKTRASILLGLDLLYDALGPTADGPPADVSHGDFARLTGHYDLYGLGLAQQLREQLAAASPRSSEPSPAIDAS
jgi:GT2 family glycosyltransferase